MHLMRKLGRVGTMAGLVLLSSIPAWADWTTNFDSAVVTMLPNGRPGVLDGSVVLLNVDLAALGTPPDEFTPSIVDTPSMPGDRALHALLAGTSGTNDSGLLMNLQPQGTNLSATMLIRFADNPVLASTPDDSSLNAGFVLHLDTGFAGGYICVMDDRGYLQLQRITNGNIDTFRGDDGQTQPGSNVTLANFDPAANWWIRFELKRELDGMHVKTRAWKDGTPEPANCQWDAQAIDPNPLLGGLSGIAINEDGNLGNGENWVNIDNVSVGSEVVCFEVCDNNVDDEGDGLTDCADDECTSSPACHCNTPFADMDGDTDVDQDDFGIFQLCYTGPGDTIADELKCSCLDRDEMNGDGKFTNRIDGDRHIDSEDLDAFVRCVSGPAIAAQADCEGPR